jgi:tripartite-type tricarboxylate transporter receptor subunit TctC
MRNGRKSLTDLRLSAPTDSAGNYFSWQVLGAPKNTPMEIVNKLNKEINAGLADPRIKARFADVVSTVFPGSPLDFVKFIAEETDKWGKVVKFLGIKAD